MSDLAAIAGQSSAYDYLLAAVQGQALVVEWCLDEVAPVPVVQVRVLAGELVLRDVLCHQRSSILQSIERSHLGMFPNALSQIRVDDQACQHLHLGVA
jgi:hypothetical protein